MSLWSRITGLLNPFTAAEEIDDMVSNNKVTQTLNTVTSLPGIVAYEGPDIAMSLVRQVWDGGVNAVTGGDKQQAASTDVAENPEVPKGIPTKPVASGNSKIPIRRT